MKPSVLLIGNFLSPLTGVLGVSEDLAEQLVAAGWQVVVSSSKQGRFAKLWDMLGTVWRRRRDYDVAHVEVYSGAAFVWAEAVCVSLRLLRKPYLLTLHGGNLPRFAARWPGRVRRLLQGATLVTTPSTYLRETMQQYCVGLRLVPNALRLENYPFRLRTRPAPRLVWLRAFHEIYNPALAVRVLAQLAGEFPDVELTMVGPDKGDGSQGQTERLAAELGVRSRLHITGPLPKSALPAVLNQADIFLNTTDVDNAPVSVLEAMACGLCVVSTKVGGIPYLLSDEQNALLVPPQNATVMAAAAKRLLMDAALAASLSQAGRQQAAQRDWSTILPTWEEVLSNPAQRVHHHA